MKKVIILFAILLLSCSSAVGETTINMSWTLPTAFCDGSVLQASDLQSIEIYISASPITASDNEACGGVRDVPPTGITPLIMPPDATTAQATLTPGVTYFIRARIQAVSGTWSNFSSELTKVVADLEPGIMQNFTLF